MSTSRKRTERATRRWPALLALAALAGCTPPEAQRVRGGGPGADAGNRTPVVELHRGARIYHATPCNLIADECETTGPETAR